MLIWFLKIIGCNSVKVIIVGNGVGDWVKNWELILMEVFFDIEVLCYVVLFCK